MKLLPSYLYFGTSGTAANGGLSVCSHVTGNTSSGSGALFSRCCSQLHSAGVGDVSLSIFAPFLTPRSSRSIAPPPFFQATASFRKQSGSALRPPLCAYQPREQEPLADVLKKAGKRALGGGIPGAAAMGIQVLSLMWMRTTVNYQYRHGGSMKHAFHTLYRDGGVVRFYRGVGPALVQGPLSRFGDTASNAGTLALLESYPTTSALPVGVKTLAASAAAAGFRILLMPVDAMKTTMQVEGKHGLTILGAKIRKSGFTVVYHGALAASAATFVGHYPWFFVYNYLNEALPQYDVLHKKLLRSAVIGFSASLVSDTCSNSIRVVKTTKQTSAEALTYPAAVRMIIAKDGVLGLFGRGLTTKILSNGMQGILFTVLWRLGQDYYNKVEGAGK